MSAKDAASIELDSLRIDSHFERCTRQIQKDGYCLIEDLFNPGQVKTALNLVRFWDKDTSSKQSADRPNLASEDHFVLNLQNKDFFFIDALFKSSALMNIFRHFLNDPWYTKIPRDKANFIFRSYVARTGKTPLPLHLDTFLPHPGKYPCVMQAIIALEDQTLANGCTVIVPGSHLTGEYASQDFYADAIPLEYRAGDALILDSRVWHGARPNTTSNTRWAVIATFCRWWLKQSFNMPSALPQKIYEKLNDEQKAVIGFCSIPPDDEMESFDCKHGFEALRDNVEEYSALPRSVRKTDRD